MNQFIDHTLLKQNAVKEDFIKLCEEAKQYQFKTVCVNGSRVPLVAELLKGSGVGVCATIGFPLGAMSTASKAFEAAQCIQDGANEIDMVLNVGKLLDGDYEYVVKDIAAVKQAIGQHTLKVIIEACLLNDEQKVMATQAVIDAKADFVKTSTGFSTHGATKEDVALLKSVAKDIIEVKAAGGVRSYEDVMAMLEAGATRIGTSSGVSLMQGDKTEGSY
ncbi:MAG: deoxyribose-phosphate aldolase [Erysipelothrix sp.]|nr:deoxyribose-phosphate aldolase [Erysipelothrix sp.]